jgi:hypothetical protein
MAQFPRLGVVVPLPVQLPESGEPQPYKKHRQSPGIALHPVQQLIAQVETVHQGPGIAAHFRVDDLLGKVEKLRVRERSFFPKNLLGR